MYSLKTFKLDSYEELVSMFYDMYCEIYHDRKIGLKYRYYQKVIEWIEKNHNIIVCYKDNIAVGFTLSYMVQDGLTEPYYFGELAYVKPEYRKTRASYMLYKNVVNYAEELGMLLVSNSRIENGVDSMVQKHFNTTPTYITVERKHNG